MVIQKSHQRFGISDLLRFPHSILYANDFNSPHTDWGYDNKSADKDCLATCDNSNNLALFYNPNDTASFYSDRWNTGTNPDLSFAALARTVAYSKEEL